MRYTIPTAVRLLLVKNNTALLTRRRDTGWHDGEYSLVGGHVDGNEFLTAALLREAREEIGITFLQSDARFVHLIHCVPSTEKEYLLVGFEVTKWSGQVAIREQATCDGLQWFPFEIYLSMSPPSKTIINGYLEGFNFSEVIY